MDIEPDISDRRRARALEYRGGPIRFEEATSSLDNESEALIQEAMFRLSTVRGVDTIFVLREGAVVEQGDHNELMAKEGCYSRLYRRRAL
jgi:ABC-type multidrug transport system fused ATPase/permease subunit